MDVNRALRQLLDLDQVVPYVSTWLKMAYGDMDRTELEKTVAVMRRLGVIQWGEITLGPEPLKPPVAEDGKQLTLQERVKADRRAHYETLLDTVVSDELLEKLP